MPRSVTTALLLGALAGAAQGQTPCHATVRDLVSPTAMAQLARMENGSTGITDVIGDGAACTRDSLATARFARARLAWVAPLVRTVYARELPDARNDGPIWTGRGLNLFVRAGVTFDATYLHVALAPELGYAQNRPFAFFPGADSARSPFASPWYVPPYSADLPSRFGTSRVVQLLPGESAAWLTVRGVDFGVSTSSQAWGPGLRGHLLLGPDAPGVPRAFVRTSHPVATPIGNFSAQYFAGTLTKSPFFDADSADNLRTLTGWTLAWTPGPSGNTVIGVERLGMQAGSPWWSSGNGSPQRGATQQMNGVLARVRSPDDGVRAWVEIARAGGLPTARQFFTVPYQGVVYQAGAAKGITTAAGTLLVTGEATDLEQPTDIRGQPSQDFYTSSVIPQGWTQRGRILGDPIGPGGNSQWASIDWVTHGWSAGVFFERVRWNEDAFLRQYLAFPNRHDVTLRLGLRGSVAYGGQELSAELSTGRRLNYEFQNGSYIPGYYTVDIPLTELRFSIAPRIPRR